MTNKPLRILSLGAGVQSTALYLMAEQWETTPDLAIFADTHFEPLPVYEHLNRLQTIGTIPIEIVSAGNIKQDTLQGKSINRRFASMPFFTRNENGAIGMVRRQCTYDYKIRPIRQRIKDILTETNQTTAELWIGISFDESHRAKPADVKYITHRWPLLELQLTREHLQQWLHLRGWPSTPKSSCIGCPFHDDAFWLEMKQHRPKEFAEAVAFDHGIRNALRIDSPAYLHRSCKPLEQVVFNHEGQHAFTQFECEGMCGV